MSEPDRSFVPTNIDPSPIVSANTDPSPILFPIGLNRLESSLPRNSAFAAVLSRHRLSPKITPDDPETPTLNPNTPTLKPQLTSTANPAIVTAITAVEPERHLKRKLSTSDNETCESSSKKAKIGPNFGQVEPNFGPNEPNFGQSEHQSCVMRLPASAQSGICQQRTKDCLENQRKLSEKQCMQQKRYK